MEREALDVRFCFWLRRFLFLFLKHGMLALIHAKFVANMCLDLICVWGCVWGTEVKAHGASYRLCVVGLDELMLLLRL